MLSVSREIRHDVGDVRTPADVLAARVSKACCDVRAAGSRFPRVGKCSSSSLHQTTNHLEVVSHDVVKVPTQTCDTRLHKYEQQKTCGVLDLLDAFLNTVNCK